MRVMPCCALFVSVLLGCGDNAKTESPDAAISIDAAPQPVDATVTGPDASPGAPDATPEPDARVQPAPPPPIVADCDGLDIDKELGTVGFTFEPAVLTIKAGDTIRFTTPGRHNFASPPGAPPDKTWDTGPISPSGQIKCVTFPVAGEFPFVCTPHINRNMLGTLTVEP